MNSPQQDIAEHDRFEHDRFEHDPSVRLVLPRDLAMLSRQKNNGYQRLVTGAEIKPESYLTGQIISRVLKEPNIIISSPLFNTILMKFLYREEQPMEWIATDKQELMITFQQNRETHIKQRILVKGAPGEMPKLEIKKPCRFFMSGRVMRSAVKTAVARSDTDARLHISVEDGAVWCVQEVLGNEKLIALNSPPIADSGLLYHWPALPSNACFAGNCVNFPSIGLSVGAARRPTTRWIFIDNLIQLSQGKLSTWRIHLTPPEDDPVDNSEGIQTEMDEAAAKELVRKETVPGTDDFIMKFRVYPDLLSVIYHYTARDAIILREMLWTPPDKIPSMLSK